MNIHFVGIGGISMSSLAMISSRWGNKVSGSDLFISEEIKEKFKRENIRFFEGHSEQNIAEVGNLDLVVYTAAISKDNPELIEAKKRNLKILERCDFMGDLLKKYSSPVAIAGTHGKTTTTAMISTLAIELGLDPTVLLGGYSKNIGENGNFRLPIHKNNNYLVYEACEYADSFLKFYVKMSVILNIEADHLDYFKDLNDVRKSFAKFMAKMPEDGILVLNSNDSNVVLASQDKNVVCKNKILYSLNPDNCNYYAYDINFDDNMNSSFKVKYSKDGDIEKSSVDLGTVKLQVKGMHNVSNALSAISLFHTLGFDFQRISEAIFKFTGTDRRLQLICNYFIDSNGNKIKDVQIYDDYAHHPTEIITSLKTLKKMPHKKLWCVFQPHTYTRTKALLNDFIKALSLTDQLVMAKIYAAREIDDGSVSSKNIADSIPDAIYIDSFLGIQNYLKSRIQPGDILVTMGAGNVFQVGRGMIKV